MTGCGCILAESTEYLCILAESTEYLCILAESTEYLCILAESTEYLCTAQLSVWHSAMQANIAVSLLA